MPNRPKIVFITESIRRDTQAPLRYFKDFEVVHLYLNAPYGDMSKSDLAGCKKVSLDSMVREIIKEKPQIIQGVEPFGSRLGLRLSILSLKAKRKTGAKLVCPVFENRPITQRFNAVQRLVLRWFCPRFFKECDAVIALNRGAVKNIRYYFDKAKIKSGVIWGVWGVDTDYFRPIGEKKKNLIIYVGRWIPEKGIMYLLEGFKKALLKIPTLKLNLIGQGELEEEMRRFVKNNSLDKEVEFTGFIKNENLPEYFSCAELCVYPSYATKRWEEQVGTVNFQSLSCGTPILTTLSGAIAEYIHEGEGAMLVESGSSEAIEKALVKFFTDGKFKEELTRKARSAAQEYDVKREILKAEKLLKSVLDE